MELVQKSLQKSKMKYLNCAERRYDKCGNYCSKLKSEITYQLRAFIIIIRQCCCRQCVHAVMNWQMSLTKNTELKIQSYFKQYANIRIPLRI